MKNYQLYETIKDDMKKKLKEYEKIIPYNERDLDNHQSIGLDKKLQMIKDKLKQKQEAIDVKKEITRRKALISLNYLHDEIYPEQQEAEIKEDRLDYNYPKEEFRRSMVKTEIIDNELEINDEDFIDNSDSDIEVKNDSKDRSGQMLYTIFNKAIRHHYTAKSPYYSKIYDLY
jgi:hypothetical protein